MSVWDVIETDIGVRAPPYIPSREDLFYRLAKEEGFRARSAFKLLHVDEITGIFSGVTRAVDLCAAPGSWSQLMSHELTRNASAAAAAAAATAAAAGLPAPAAPEAKVVAVDLQEMAPIPGVVCILGDITAKETADAVVAEFGGELAQLIVCDGAPDVTGLHQIDEDLQLQLMFAALLTTTRVLEKGGSFVSKLFRGDSLDHLQAQMSLMFETVEVFKPSSSRIRSAEHFIVGRGYRWGRGQVTLDMDGVVIPVENADTP